MATTTRFSPPPTNEYAEYYHQYISLFTPEDFLSEFRNQPDQLHELVGNVPEEEVNKQHAPYTWTLKQVVGHLIDCERIFSTRALRIAANDQTPIPGIDQNIYVDNQDYNSVSMSDLVNEFRLLREANTLLAQRMNSENLERMGIASDNEVSARANIYILAGHFLYHFNIMKNRLA